MPCFWRAFASGLAFPRLINGFVFCSLPPASLPVLPLAASRGSHIPPGLALFLSPVLAFSFFRALLHLRFPPSPPVAATSSLRPRAFLTHVPGPLCSHMPWVLWRGFSPARFAFTFSLWNSVSGPLSRFLLQATFGSALGVFSGAPPAFLPPPPVLSPAHDFDTRPIPFPLLLFFFHLQCRFLIPHLPTFGVPFFPFLSTVALAFALPPSSFFKPVHALFVLLFFLLVFPFFPFFRAPHLSSSFAFLLTASLAYPSDRSLIFSFFFPVFQALVLPGLLVLRPCWFFPVFFVTFLCTFFPLDSVFLYGLALELAFSAFSPLCASSCLTFPFSLARPPSFVASALACLHGFSSSRDFPSFSLSPSLLSRALPTSTTFLSPPRPFTFVPVFGQVFAVSSPPTALRRCSASPLVFSVVFCLRHPPVFLQVLCSPVGSPPWAFPLFLHLHLLFTVVLPLVCRPPLLFLPLLRLPPYGFFPGLIIPAVGPAPSTCPPVAFFFSSLSWSSSHPFCQSFLFVPPPSASFRPTLRPVGGVSLVSAPVLRLASSRSSALRVFFSYCVLCSLLCASRSSRLSTLSPVAFLPSFIVSFPRLARLLEFRIGLGILVLLLFCVLPV